MFLLLLLRLAQELTTKQLNCTQLTCCSDTISESSLAARRPLAGGHKMRAREEDKERKGKAAAAAVSSVNLNLQQRMNQEKSFGGSAEDRGLINIILKSFIKVISFSALNLIPR